MTRSFSFVRGTSGWTGLALAAAFLQSGAAQAQIGAKVADPPVLGPVDAPPPDDWRTFAPLAAEEQKLDLTITYVDGTIANPITNGSDKVHLRSSVETGQPAGKLFVAPAIHTRPGQTVRVMLRNQLPADPTCQSGDHEPNKPHCFNGTNLHTHGLWISPAEHGDNVLMTIYPGQDFEYIYEIPSEHPAGTFWYHTHRHGSTAMQVSSGMAGALIIHGDRMPQIQYYCLKDGKVVYVCGPNDVGQLESYGPLALTWGSTKRYTSINGLVLPDFDAEQGKLERWRVIHGGIRDTIALQFRRARTSAPLAAGSGLSTEKMEGEVLPYHLVASDGLTMPAAQKVSVATFQPGYRYDALVNFPEEGSYCVIDAASKAGSSVGGVPSGSRLLAMVRVAKGVPVADPDAHLRQQLVAEAERIMPDGIKAAVVDDLNHGLKLSHFVPHPPITEAETAGRKQFLTFSGTSVGGNDASGNIYEPRPYLPGRLDRALTLGTAEQWELTAKGAGHPFHIHVNPFEVVEILTPAPNSRDVSPLGANDDGDTQYPGLKGTWRDTLWIKPGYTVKVRTRYERFLGEFVLHCHILEHEDRGMMQNVAVIAPGNPPESVNAESYETAHH
jgi:L-ascorbate oxidase